MHLLVAPQDGNGNVETRPARQHPCRSWSQSAVILHKPADEPTRYTRQQPAPQPPGVPLPLRRASSKPTHNDSADADCQPIATDALSPSGPVPTGQERVATVFTWTHGGKNVAVTGTWNNWQGVIPLNRSEHDFTAIIDLPPGVHQYKFIVDGKWTHAADQPVATDSGGNINNCMEIKEFRLGQSKNNALGRGSPPGSYTQEIPELIKFNDMFDEPQDLGTPGPGGQKKKPDEPPVLPPHLLGTRATIPRCCRCPTM
ncbi:AMP-activated protein kinase, putative [Acanthamoeba castellanii str. Neff]|uniref:AMP-activated protein kinase, putative n=1 Tax=Acanthamoeba castellanii (strain ATCC 30010 / Neff) TaxID=1257118 RepID=L8GET5_ACACF|nr:AMP-activated protein kinase, putative [Acanthamoeba castellanii str. Neff]ELR11389.1 AMP-activated protein kinase, putative [Acanthamoeba castellanii str. Neff]